MSAHRSTTRHSSTTETSPVSVFIGNQESTCKQETFQLCPLGLQFYAHKPLREFDLYEFDLQIPGRKNTAQQISCTGAVVRCQKEKAKGTYRVWIKFLDLPEKAREQIRCCSKNGKFMCCFCENF